MSAALLTSLDEVKVEAQMREAGIGVGCVGISQHRKGGDALQQEARDGAETAKLGVGNRGRERLVSVGASRKNVVLAVNEETGKHLHGQVIRGSLAELREREARCRRG